MFSIRVRVSPLDQAAGHDSAGIKDLGRFNLTKPGEGERVVSNLSVL